MRLCLIRAVVTAYKNEILRAVKARKGPGAAVVRKLRESIFHMRTKIPQFHLRFGLGNLWQH